MAKRSPYAKEIEACAPPKKRGRKSNAEKAAGMAQIAATIGGPVADADADVRAEFLSTYSGMWKALKNKEAIFNEEKGRTHDAIKEKGFLVKQFRWLDRYNGTPVERAAALKEIEMPVEVLKWIGEPLGAQLSLELNRPDRTPAVERAYDQGKVACMEGKSCSPPYDASVPQYAEWINGYHDETARRVKAGIQPLAGDGTLDEAADEFDDDPPPPDHGGDPLATVGLTETPLPASLANLADPARPL